MSEAEFLAAIRAARAGEGQEVAAYEVETQDGKRYVIGRAPPPVVPLPPEHPAPARIPWLDEALYALERSSEGDRLLADLRVALVQLKRLQDGRASPGEEAPLRAELERLREAAADREDLQAAIGDLAAGLDQ